MAMVGDNSTMVGSNNMSNASDSVAVGTNNNSGGQYTVSIGHYNKASAAKTITVGYYAEADFESGVAIGANAKAMAKDSVAVGSASEANEENTFSIGSMINQRRIVNVADGTKNTDGATYGQIIKAGDYTITLGTDGKGQVTLQTNAGANGPKIQVDASALAGGAGVDAKLGDITSNNYVNAGNTVNANISALDKQMKVNTDNIGDTNKLTTAGLGSNLSDAVVNVNNKADKNAEDIKTVNGRVDELGGRVDTLGGAVSKLDTKVNKVGAGAAALAALHPMDFDPDNKLSFAAGVGSYHGASAVAIGAFYRPSEQVMFSISGNMGNGENMVNAGVSFALDRPSKTPTTKAALVKTVAAQNEQIAALKETVAEQNEKIARLEAMVEKLAAKQST